VLLAVLALAFAIALSGCGEKAARLPKLEPGEAIVAFGDSLTYGTGARESESYPAVLATLIGREVVRAGVPGEVTAQGVRRLPEVIEEFQPRLVIVCLGGNDMLRHVPQQETVANLEQILALIKESGAKAVLLATPQPSIAGAVFQHLSAPDFYRQVADAQQVPLIEDAIADVVSDPQLKVDPLHPNAAGHALLSERIFAALQSMGYAR
jgi:lysophospholipase L1-like esterase